MVYKRKKVLITVKTYPTPARKGIEVSCTAGVTENGKWIRLFSMPFRFLESKKQFKLLEKIPYKFIYSFVCRDPECKGHRLSVADWEVGEAYRSWRQQYGNQWEQPFRHKFEAEMIHKYDTHFYVGTLRAYPDRWIIMGLFYPPKA